MLQDFRYAMSTARQVAGRDIRRIRGPLNEVFQAVAEPAPQTLCSELPVPLQASWDRSEVLRIAREWAEQQDPSRQTMVHSCLERTGFVFLGEDLAAEKMILLPLLPRVDPNGASDQISEALQARAGPCLRSVRDEIDDTEDPIALRCGIAVMLTLRPYVDERTARDLFGSAFDRWLHGLLTEFEGDDPDPQWSNLRVGWQLVRRMAAGYLRHLDLEAESVFPESERRVAVAWWLAWRFGELAREVMRGMDLPASERTGFLQHWCDVAAERSRGSWIRHLFTDHHNSVARQRTLDGDERDAPLLSASMVATVAPQRTEHASAQLPSAFGGLMQPSTLLTPASRDRIIDLSAQSALRAEFYRRGSKDVLPWHWSDPPCESGPRLVRRYYGESFAYLGQDRRSILETAELLASDPDLEEAASVIPKWAEEGRSELVSAVCRLVAQGARAGGELPAKFREVFESDPNLRQIAQLRGPASGDALVSLSAALVGLYCGGRPDEGHWLAERLGSVDLSPVADDDAASATENVMVAVLLGAPPELLERYVDGLKSRASVREALKNAREALDDVFHHVPPQHRDRARLILNLLSSIESG
jgi:hypothetical protein